MKITCLGTGSSGNCFHVEGMRGTGIFLDAGIPPKTIQGMRIKMAGAPVLVTHEHGDHGQYAGMMQDRYGCEIYCSRGTGEALGLDQFHEVKALVQPKVRSFPVIHTAAEPVGFYIMLDGEAILYVADAGSPPALDDYYWALLRPSVIIVEANYTDKRLAENAEKSPSALYVAGRVSSGVGHMSAYDSYTFCRPFLEFGDVNQIILFHQSKNNFSKVEFYQDRRIGASFMERVSFAEAGKVWDTIPF